MDMEEIKAMEIQDLDLSEVKDGVYRGNYEKSKWLYELEISVESNSITEIVVIKNDSQGGEGSTKLTDKLTQKVVDTQSITFDAVSGATVDTKIFQKAIENALLGTSLN